MGTEGRAAFVEDDIHIRAQRVDQHVVPNIAFVKFYLVARVRKIFGVSGNEVIDAGNFVALFA